jgi:hypothetical protein
MSLLEPVSNLRHGIEKEIRAKPCLAGRPSPGLWPAVAEAIVVEVVAAITAEAVAAGGSCGSGCGGNSCGSGCGK